MPMRPRSGRYSDVAPHEVVVELLRRGLLEGVHLAALRIDARHDVLDRAVLAGRVHRLEDQQQRPAILGVEHVLLFRQPRGAALEELRRLALVHLQAAGVARIEVFEPEALAFGDAVRSDVLPYEVENFLSRHEFRLLFLDRNVSVLARQPRFEGRLLSFIHCGRCDDGRSYGVAFGDLRADLQLGSFAFGFPLGNFFVAS